MIEVDLQIYVYALYILMVTSILTFIFIIRMLRGVELSVASINLFKVYFILGVIGWIGQGLKDTAQLDLDTRVSLTFYIVCSFLLLLAVTECSRNKKKSRIFGAMHVVAIIIGMLLPDDASRLTLLSVFVLLTYPFISYIAFKRAWSNKNLGQAIMGFATAVVAMAAPIQLYSLYGMDDINFAFGIVLIASSTGFLLVGIGFISSILLSEHNALSQLALKDALTGLYNRRGLEFSLNVSVGQAQRNQQCISVIALDIDYFKKINDQHGHDAGDRVLEEIAQILTRLKRSSDVACRLGGEEFVVVLPDTPVHDAQQMAERVREVIEQAVITYEKENIKLTSSFGVASHCELVDMEELLKQADKALYEAKSKGRNRVCLFAQTD